MTSLIAAIAASLHPASAASSGITYVGGNRAAAPMSSLALPSGCATGDYVLVLFNGNSSNTISLSGSTTLLAETPFGNGRYMAVLSYVLTSADISNGSVAISASGGNVSINVFRGQNATPVDAQSAMDVGTHAHPPVCVTDSITTTVANDMVVILSTFNLAGSAAGGATFPAGFTLGNSSASGSNPVCLAYALQAAAGATGTLQSSYANGNSGYGGSMSVAIKPA